MAYTSKQLTMAWTAVHDGIAPDAATQAALDAFVNTGATDAQSLSYVVNSVDGTTALAVLSYQFFTGKSPTKEGIDYLVNSTINTADLNDAYYAQFNLENRYINFAANLGVNGAGATDFAAKYGAMSFSDYVASIYETIIGAGTAKAAGVDVDAAIKYLIGTKDNVLATAKAAGMITDGMTAAQIDLALKAAMAGLVMAAAIKADIGTYAAASNNFMLALAKGDAVYNTDILTAYGPASGKGSTGTGKAVDTAPATLPGAVAPPEPPKPVPSTTNGPQSFTLPFAQSIASGADGDDTFRATPGTLSGSTLKGGGGNDTLIVTGATGGTYVVDPAGVTGIETVNLTNDRGLVVDTTTWTGLTRLNITAGGEVDANAGPDTDVTAHVSNPGKADVLITGGHDVDVTVTDTGNANVLVGGATGDISITRQLVGDAFGGFVGAGGGVNIDITLTSVAPAAGEVQAQGIVLVFGEEHTSTVTITGPASVQDNGKQGEIVAAGVLIQDFNYGSATDLGTIATVWVDGFQGLQFGGTGLKTLTALHGGDIEIHNDGPLTGETVLTATLNDIHGIFDDEGVYQTLHVTHGPDDSEIDLGMDGLKTLTIGGSGNIDLLTDYSTSLETVTVTGSVGLEADLSGATVTSVSTAGTTGDSTLKIDGGKATFAGGSGDDHVTLTSTTVSKAISLGGGDDTIVLPTGVTTPTVTIDGGTGTDTLVMDAATAQANAAITGKFTSFERLVLANATSQSLVMDLLGFHHLTTSGGNTLFITGLTSGDTLVLNGAGTGYAVNGFFSGGSDNLNLTLEDKTGAGVLFGNIIVSGLETLNVTTKDDSDSPTGVQERLSLTGTGLQTVSVSGNAGLTLTSGVSALATVNAAGITQGGLNLTLSAAASAITVTGTTAGTNTVNAGSIGSTVTYTGGSAVDTVTIGSTSLTGAISLGGDDDVLSLTNINAIPTVTIDGGTGTDTLILKATAAASLSGSTAFGAKFTSFERLKLTTAGVDTINLGNLGFHHVAISGTGGAILNGMSSGDTVVLDGTGTGYDAYLAVDSANDSLNIVLEDSAGAGAFFAAGFQTSGFERIAITTHDGSATPAGAMEFLPLTGQGVETITVTGNAGLNLRTVSSALSNVDASALTLGGLTLTLFDAASAITIKGSTTAANTIDATSLITEVVSYIGGSGVDNVILGSAALTGAISLGGGDDILNLALGLGATPTVTIDGGAGTADVLRMTAADAAAQSASTAFAAKVIGFERLTLTSAGNQTVNLGNLGYHNVTTSGGTGLTLNGMTSGDTLVLSGAGAGYTASLATNGASDVLNLVLKDAAGAGLTFANTLTIADIETLNVTTLDGSATPTGVTETLKITTGGQKVVNISGNAGLDLTLASTGLTTVDASGITKGGFTWTAGAITGPITIKGSATGTNTVNITQTTGVVTYEGGAGDDVLTPNSSNNSSAIIHFGEGNNRIIGYASVVTAGSGDDNIALANGGSYIDLGDGNNTYYTPSQVSTTIKTGSGNDSINIGGGTASIDVGSGNDYVSIASLTGSSFTSITGMGANDRLDLSNFSNASAMGAKLVGQITLGGYLSIAGHAVAGTNNAMEWFELNGDIYIVVDQSDLTSFDAGYDGLVRLVGVAGTLNVSLAGVAGGGITFH